MSAKLLVKNLNVKNLAKDFCQEINGIDLDSNIETLIETIRSSTKLTNADLDLINNGQILNPKNQLKQYLAGKNVAILYLAETKQVVINKEKPFDLEITSLLNQLVLIFKRKSRRNLLEKLLQNHEKTYSILNKVFDLRYDIISCNFLQSYDLLKLLCEKNKADIFFQAYPNIFYGLKAIVDYINSIPLTTSIEGFLSKGSFSIDEMSEDEEQPVMAQQPNMRRPVGPSITQDYLSSILASINQQMNPQSQSQAQTQTQSLPQAQQSLQQQQPQQQQRQPFDRNIFQSLMQQLVNPSSSSATVQNESPMDTTTQSATSSNQAQPNAQQTSRMSDEEIATKLEQMHEFGFFDDELNIRALQVTEGNVEAAINFIVEGGGEF